MKTYTAKDVRGAFEACLKWVANFGEQFPLPEQALAEALRRWPDEEPKRWVCRGCGETVDPDDLSDNKTRHAVFVGDARGVDFCGPVEETP